VDWGRFAVAVIRTAWDTDSRRDEFVAWADRAGKKTRLWNPPGLLRWNTHKSYLRELAQRGISTVPTAWLERGSKVALGEVLAARGWTDAVVKPAVSAGARDTVRVRRPEDLPAAQALVDRIIPHKDFMVQPYVPAVDGYGERSFLFIDGEFTHAVRKLPALATQGYDPTRTDPVKATGEEIAFGRRVIAAAPFPLLYARVDAVPDADGRLQLMELEATEPNLFLRHGPGAAERYAAAVEREAGRGPVR
jgi:glutathione synthase/RimK-type ligase-like ATP-grasp enzyme